MSGPISVRCPSCQASLKLKNRDALGKRVPCPKCGERFVLKAAAKPQAAEKPKAAPRKVETKKPAHSLADSNDGFEDFSEYEEYDDGPVSDSGYAPRGLPPVTNRRRNQVESPPRSAEAADVPKKRKKKRRQSDGPAVPLGLVGMLIGGTIGGAIGAGIWAGVGYATNYEVGWIAWGVGVLVGIGVRVAADDGDGTFPGMIAAALAVVAVLAGKYMVVSLLVDHVVASGAAADQPFIDDAMRNAAKADIFKESFGGFDLLWFGLAAVTAFKIGAGIEDGD